MQTSSGLAVWLSRRQAKGEQLPVAHIAPPLNVDAERRAMSSTLFPECPPTSIRNTLHGFAAAFVSITHGAIASRHSSVQLCAAVSVCRMIRIDGVIEWRPMLNLNLDRYFELNKSFAPRRESCEFARWRRARRKMGCD